MELKHATLFRCAPGLAAMPADVALHACLGPIPMSIPSTVAAACLDAGVWSMEHPSFALDEFDWWIKVDLEAGGGLGADSGEASPQIASPQISLTEARNTNGFTELHLRAHGLATLCEVWWNGALAAKSASMFAPLSAPLYTPLSAPLYAELKSVDLDETLEEPPGGESSTSERSERSNDSASRSLDLELGSETNGLWLCFRSVSEHLRATANRKDRPAWKSKLVDHQGLRRVRTSLLGRMPGWSPPVVPIGPYRPMHLSIANDLADPANIRDVHIRTTDTGSLSFSASVSPTVVSAKIKIFTPTSPGRENPCQGEVLIELNATCSASPDGSATSLDISGVVANVELWWPHTHGEPTLYTVAIELTDSNHVSFSHDLAPIGFRSAHVDTRDYGFGIVMNGEPVFARGACWTPVDLTSLNGSDALLEDTLESVVAAGMNMVRIGGTMTYETDRFHQRCDALGIMVWQDFMFANLDVPLDSEDLLRDIRAEVSHHASRVGNHPSTVVVCGGSEVDQQAAMMGVGAERWSNGLARSVIAPICAQIIPELSFVASSPSAPNGSDALPFHVDSGVGHYYGVGAYLRGFDDARRANVRFAAECLAFANVPETATLDALFGDGGQGPHQPFWKQRVPRDNGAGWDFDDVRDHYTAELFGLDPTRLRYADLDRWFDLARITSTEVLDAVASEWRRGDSTCRGALVWFLRDLWTGAGWGLIDATGRPKPGMAGLARRWQNIALSLTDEGVNGLDAHLVNETIDARIGTLEAVVVRDGTTIVERASRLLRLEPRSTTRIRVDDLFDGFRDLTWAYRFGPPIGEMIRVRLTTTATVAQHLFEGRSQATATVQLASGSQPTSDSQPIWDSQPVEAKFAHDPIVCDAHHWPTGRPNTIEASTGLSVQGEQIGSNDKFRVTVSTERMAFGVHLEGDEVRSTDNWFHLAPGDQRTIVVHRPRGFQRQRGKTPPRITICALNSRASARLQWD